MEILAAITVGLSGLIVIGLSAKSNTYWLFPVLSGYAARCVVAVIHRYYYPLPQGRSDAEVFLRVGEEYSRMGCGSFFDHVQFGTSYVYSSLIAEFYSCVGYSPLAIQILNSIFGALSIVVMATCVRLIWGEKYTYAVCWILAFWPPLLIYSAVALRESVILLMFALGMKFFVAANRNNRTTNLLFSFLCFSTAGIFHSGMYFAIPAVFLSYVLVRDSGYRLRVSSPVAIIGKSFLALGLCFPFVPLLLSLSINKVGEIGQLDLDLISQTIESRADGGAAYLQNLPVNSADDIVWQLPIRLAYFLYSPFPWDISSVQHVFGVTDGLPYLLFTIILLRNWRFFRSNKVATRSLVVFVVLSVVFSMGTSNFSTGMRHRSKFAILLLVIVAPLVWQHLQRRIARVS